MNPTTFNPLPPMKQNNTNVVEHMYKVYYEWSINYSQ